MNYYEILKLPKTASKEQIKSSYKKLVKKYHPDLYVGDKNFAEQKIKEINEAYSILADTQSKLEYDSYLNLTETAVSSHPFPPSSDKQTNPSPQTASWSFSQFVTEKISTLTHKRQMQIFILILVIFLALFLINLVEISYYLSPSTPSSNITNSYDNPSTPKPSMPSNSVHPDDFQTLDDFFYDFFKTYENEFENLF